jgi:hypothetical protein
VYGNVAVVAWRTVWEQSGASAASGIPFQILTTLLCRICVLLPKKWRFEIYLEPAENHFFYLSRSFFKFQTNAASVVDTRVNSALHPPQFVCNDRRLPFIILPKFIRLSHKSISTCMPNVNHTRSNDQER